MDDFLLLFSVIPLIEIQILQILFFYCLFTSSFTNIHFVDDLLKSSLKNTLRSGTFNFWCWHWNFIYLGFGPTILYIYYFKDFSLSAGKLSISDAGNSRTFHPWYKTPNLENVHVCTMYIISRDVSVSLDIVIKILSQTKICTKHSTVN